MDEQEDGRKGDEMPEAFTHGSLIPRIFVTRRRAGMDEDVR
jgi:hypothetical protein